MKHYTYKITNNINGKYYYGVHSTDNLDDGYMGSGTLIIKAIDKYGVENFTKEILEFFDTAREAYAREAELVTRKEVDNPMCYNIRGGGVGGSKIYTEEEMKEHHDEYMRKYCEANKDVKREYDREHYEANKEQFKERSKQYYAANKNAKREYDREHYEANKEQFKERYEANKEQILEKQRAHHREYYKRKKK